MGDSSKALICDLSTRSTEARNLGAPFDFIFKVSRFGVGLFFPNVLLVVNSDTKASSVRPELERVDQVDVSPD
jgi:hypothetical protein